MQTIADCGLRIAAVAARRAGLLLCALSLLLCSLVAAQTPSGRTGTISGRVVGEDGPVAGASVNASAVSGAPGPGRSATTDADGSFILRDLPARSYRLFASVPGYVTDFDSASASLYHLGDNVTLNLLKGGVITGRLFNSVGEPVIAANVVAQRVRDAEGKPVPGAGGLSGRPAQTDDRGAYRIYGLLPGSYLVVVNSSAGFFTTRATPYDGDTPVFYPSATRDTASEVQVAAGTTASGIDIRYRSEPGRIISGKLTGALDTSRGFGSANVTLRQVGSGNVVGQGFSDGSGGAAQGYSIRGVADGEYEVVAARFDRDNGAAAPPRRVTVRGADLTGVDLVLAPLATVAGRVVLEPNDPATAETNKCGPKRPASLEEIALRLQRDEVKPADTVSGPFGSGDTAPDDKGEFKLSNLQAGRFRLLVTPPSEAWYVKAIATGAPAPAAAPARKPGATGAAANAPAAPPAVTAASSALAIKTGDRLSGITVTLAEGAAGLQGQVIKENAKLSGRLRVHLAPAEPTAAEDLVRYYVTLSRNDGTFQFKHLAPGKYWLLARPLGDDESSERPTRPAAWDATERAKLRREAEAANQAVELTACQRAADFKLKAR